jgi:hypothetical protein
MSELQQVIQDQVKPPRLVASFYPPPTVEIVAEWILQAYSASDEPERWFAHRQAAHRNYVRRGLGIVGRDHGAASHRSPTFFSEAILDGVPIGGVRMHLPNPLGRLPILDELEGHVDCEQLAEFIKDLASEGIVHCGGLWIDPQHRGSGLAGDLGRSFMPMIVAAKVRWYIATSHQYILEAWRSLGWQPVPAFSTFPYPDERYQTCVILGDVCRWPANLMAWAQKQAAGSTLNGKGPRITIHPMRVSEDSTRKGER